jgi:hypothetical protein
VCVSCVYERTSVTNYTRPLANAELTDDHWRDPWYTPVLRAPPGPPPAHLYVRPPPAPPPAHLLQMSSGIHFAKHALTSNSLTGIKLQEPFTNQLIYPNMRA